MKYKFNFLLLFIVTQSFGMEIYCPQKIETAFKEWLKANKNQPNSSYKLNSEVKSIRVLRDLDIIKQINLATLVSDPSLNFMLKLSKEPAESKEFFKERFNVIYDRYKNWNIIMKYYNFGKQFSTLDESMLTDEQVELSNWFKKQTCDTSIIEQEVKDLHKWLKPHLCSFCSKTVFEIKTTKKKLKCCSQCKSIYYCGVECQKKDWPNHKLKCLPKK